MPKVDFRFGKYGFILDSKTLRIYDLLLDAIFTEPPYDQSVFYLGAVKYVIEDLAEDETSLARLTKESWADMGLLTRLNTDRSTCVAFGRHVDYNNYYQVYLYSGEFNADHQIRKKVNGTVTTLATEAVDLPDSTWYWILFEIVGTELRSYRGTDPTSPPPDTPTITATDTDISTGRWGVRHVGLGDSGLQGLYFFLQAPSSKAITPVKYYIVNIEGEGKSEEPFRPKIPMKLKEVNQVLYIDKEKYTKLYSILYRKGFSKEEIDEIAQIFGILKIQKYVNTIACTWSALIPTRKGKPIDSICLIRIFNFVDSRIFDELKWIGAKELNRDEAIKFALKFDDKLHIADLVQFIKEDEAKKFAKEYMEWREKQFGIRMKFEEALRYVMRPKCW